MHSASAILALLFGVLAVSAGHGHSGHWHGGHDHDKHKKDEKHIAAAAPVPIKQGPPTYTCPEDYELIDNQCIKTKHFSKVPSCKFGNLVGGECLEYTDLIYKCPAGFTAIDGSRKTHDGHHGGHGHHSDKNKKDLGCYRMETQMALRMCPPGTKASPNNPLVCESTWSQPPRSYCPINGKKHKHSGKHDNDKKDDWSPVDCIDYRAVAPLASCQDSFTLENGACVREETYECQSEVLCVGYGCANGDKKDHESHKHHHGGHHGHHLRRLQEEEEESTSTVQEDATEETTPEVEERRLGKKKGEITVKVPAKQSTCTRQIQVEPFLQCPQGTIQGNLKKGSSNSLYINPNSNNRHGHAGHNRHHNKHGDKKKDELVCYEPYSVDLVYECESGTFDRETNQCIHQSLQASEEFCPANFDFCYDKKGKSKEGDLDAPCCRSEFAAPLSVCPIGYFQNGAFCSKSHPMEYSCPPGSVLVGDECIQKYAKPPTELYNITMCQGKGCRTGASHNFGKKMH